MIAITQINSVKVTPLVLLRRLILTRLQPDYSAWFNCQKKTNLAA
jgi:hypothetical protein